MPVIQSNLPYATNALEPHFSNETMRYHYEKHHRGYVDKLNALIKDTPYDALSLPQIIDRARETVQLDILNNALQTWNHGFFWESLSPEGGDKPRGRIKDAIEKEFKNFDRFASEFRSAAIDLFGSGWVWLVKDNGRLRIITTGNGDSPVNTHLTPLLALDVWEHAYYLDYKNARADYVDAFLIHLINWDFAAANLAEIEKLKAA